MLALQEWKVQPNDHKLLKRDLSLDITRQNLPFSRKMIFIDVCTGEIKSRLWAKTN